MKPTHLIISNAIYDASTSMDQLGKIADKLNLSGSVDAHRVLLQALASKILIDIATVGYSTEVFTALKSVGGPGSVDELKALIDNATQQNPENQTAPKQT